MFIFYKSMFKKINKIIKYIYCKDINKKKKIFLIQFLNTEIRKKIFLISVFKNCIRKKMKKKNIKYNKKSIIITGTGGDKKKTFNITSSVFIILSDIFKAKIIKYGSKSFTSKVGSIDFLYYFLKKNNINLNILYSNNVFKNIKKITEIRKEICNKTIFNYIFPLINVSKSKYHIIGSSNLLLHKILKYKKKNNTLFLSGIDNMDEISIYCPSKITIFKKKIASYIINYNTIIENKKIIINTVEDSYNTLGNFFYDFIVKKIIFLNLYTIIKYFKKNKNIFFLLKITLKEKNFKDVKYFKKNSK
ncbi:hypothetical protein ACT2CC_00240 [Candidatus Vidania fulgoroideorum]